MDELESQADQGSSNEELIGPSEEHQPFLPESQTTSEPEVLEPNSTTEEDLVLPGRITSPIDTHSERDEKYAQEIIQYDITSESHQRWEEVSCQPQERDSEPEKREPRQLQKQELDQPHEQESHQTEKKTSHQTQELKAQQSTKQESHESQEQESHRDQNPDFQRHQSQETYHSQAQATVLVEDPSLESDTSVLQRERTINREAPKMNKDKKGLKIFVIGKTGTGKSSLCNKIIGGDVFRTGRSFKQVTTETKEDAATLCGLNITVVDTPDISDQNEERQKDIVKNWKRRAEGFTYMVVLTVRCDQRFSPAEYDVYRQIRKLWGHRDLCRRLVVAFTFADTREDPSVDMTEELKTVWPELKMVMKDAENRFVLFNNKPGNTDEQPVNELIELRKKIEGGLRRRWKPGDFALLLFPLAILCVWGIVVHMYLRCSHDPSSYLCPWRE